LDFSYSSRRRKGSKLLVFHRWGRSRQNQICHCIYFPDSQNNRISSQEKMSLFTQYFESYDIYVNCYKQIIREKVVFVRLQAREVKERVSGSIRGQGGPGPPPVRSRGPYGPPRAPPVFSKFYLMGLPLNNSGPPPFFCHPTSLERVEGTRKLNSQRQ